MTETYPEKRLIGYARVSAYGQTHDTPAQQKAATGRRAEGATLQGLAHS